MLRFRNGIELDHGQILLVAVQRDSKDEINSEKEVEVVGNGSEASC